VAFYKYILLFDIGKAEHRSIQRHTPVHRARVLAFSGQFPLEF